MMKAAREFLGLSQEDVEAVSGLSRTSVQRIERGTDVDPHYVAALYRFYLEQGITFVPPAGDDGWGMLNANVKGDRPSLNRLERIPAPKRKKVEASAAAATKPSTDDQTGEKPENRPHTKS